MRRKHFKLVNLALLSGLLGLYAVANAVAQGDDVNKRFDEMSKSFSSLAGSFGNDGVTTWKVPSAFVKRQFIARSVSSAIANAGISVTVSFPGQHVSAPYTKVTTASIDPIPCNADRGCNSDCGWDLGCALAKLDCERLKAQEKLFCEAKKTAQGAISDKLILTVFLYDIDTGASDTVWITANGNAQVSALNVADDLKAATLVTNASASALVSTKAKFVFEAVLKALLILLTGNPTCLLDEEFYIKEQPVGFDQANLQLPISLSDPYVKDDQLKIDLQFQKTSITLRFQRSPIAELIESDWRNLRNIVSCPNIPVASVIAEEAFPNDMVKKDQDLPAISQTQTLTSMPAPVVAGQEYKVSLITTNTALGLRADRKQ